MNDGQVSVNEREHYMAVTGSGLRAPASTLRTLLDRFNVANSHYDHDCQVRYDGEGIVYLSSQPFHVSTLLALKLPFDTFADEFHEWVVAMAEKHGKVKP